MKLPAPLLALLQHAVDRYLALDPRAVGELAALSGRVMAIDVKGLDLTLYLVPDAGGLAVRDIVAGTPETCLRGTPFALARLGLTAGSRNALADIEIEGNAELGQTLQNILGRIEFDWEEALSKIAGDVVAHQVGRQVRDARARAQAGADSLRQDVGEYLREEARLLPPRVIVEDFMNAVDTLRSDVDRLAARIERLSARQGGS